MPFVHSGVYIDTMDKAYEAESSYYLEFQIKSALISIKKIKNSFYDDFDSKCQYYHYYTDHLLYSMGQIANRFIVTNNDNPMNIDRKRANCVNFEFDAIKYPILSDKTGRNTIEHIDEHNQKTIRNQNGVGGFNLIDTDTEQELIKVFYNYRKAHPYTLDLMKNEVLIVRNEKEINISIDNLEQELRGLLKRVAYVLEYLTKSY